MVTLVLVGVPLQLEPCLLRRHLQRVREAMRLADVNVEKSSLYLGINKSLLQRWLSGEGHFSLFRLWQMPDEFLRCYCALVLRDLGLPWFLRNTDGLHAIPLRMAKAAMDSPTADAHRERA